MLQLAVKDIALRGFIDELVGIRPEFIDITTEEF
jgi:hypothetical protein